MDLPPFLLPTFPQVFGGIGERMVRDPNVTGPIIPRCLDVDRTTTAGIGVELPLVIQKYLDYFLSALTIAHRTFIPGKYGYEKTLPDVESDRVSVVVTRFP